MKPITEKEQMEINGGVHYHWKCTFGGAPFFSKKFCFFEPERGISPSNIFCGEARFLYHSYLNPAPKS